ncbi:hypothetical protein QE342_gp007 [Pseudomonas phage vB_PaeS_B8]|uniref:hypothetical protein n=1 Tax=Pseudomonas phage C11 TaxID=1735586 RepID=UPI0006D2E831|nr:hypothetical protein AU075_gp042 [Pseudomonas phage C11]YP_009199981.1 hypothetical protein K8_044 [Pseudomonas phage K8]YP_009273799.1 hypothetical protein BH773_gp044 [Pseudomonas phage K5]YP_010764413.1 hypothetical protein QE342_gp007 [Pseudomonas phage vB_PaeS_B8]AXY86797.1 hypothetical protein PaYy2_3 [Pseudomonas phage PaYy-2]QAU05314.1 hypothetical protein S2_042 [Pseudomonas phage vB_PaeM_SCUT-S2]ALF51366.1 hypothetical protein K8_044 [Pseudomonas phage K8]ALJ97502.1 hypothetical
MRDEFEAWWRSAEVLKSKRAVAFDAWQASRSALRVELPDDGIADCQRDWPNSCRDNFDTGYCYATDRITQALQQAGIEVT